MEIKRDRYLRARGGKARVINIFCSHCQAFVLTYQKDGPGRLLRCYLNRIFAPAYLKRLQENPAICEPRDIPQLICLNCKTIIGTPMRYLDGRLAFRLRKAAYSTTIIKGEERGTRS